MKFRRFVTFVACMLTTAAALAVPVGQVHRTTTQIKVTGPCCQDISGETVTITEPANLVSVVLEWSMEYVSTGPFAVGVRINGGGCGDYGPEYIPTKAAVRGTPFYPTTIQFVILPSDGLIAGSNTLTVCEGPTVNNNDTMTIGTRTLAVHISK